MLLVCVIFLSINVNAQKKVKTYKVLAACGPCQFNESSPNGCALAIKMADKVYWVDGSTLADHGNEHATDGMCKTIRKAEVQGKITGNRIDATSFALLPEKKKK